ncbi:MAG TPA: NADPH-dependent F420 reductase [Acidimicrobiales bacterium]|nr:NADPH-dependent F420 reductase [Acidimicrobiales bacterium]
MNPSPSFVQGWRGWASGCNSRQVRVGILGGTGPAGSALAARLSSVGIEVVIGSRSQERASQAVQVLFERWPSRGLTLAAGTNETAAGADLVVVATPWEGAVVTVRQLTTLLEGKTVVTMVNAMSRWGDRFVPLIPPTGSVAVAIAGALPASRVAGAFHHLPARPLGELDKRLDADVMVFSDHPAATEEVIGLIGRVPGLRGVDAGGLASAMAIESLTAVLVEVNRRYKVHASLKVTGIE